MESKVETKQPSENVIVGRHYPVIDGLRGLACIMVLWFHSSLFSHAINPAVPKIYYNFSMLGQSGVDLFFVLSGFLITGILMDTSRDPKVLQKFYIRRSLRIFPLYYATILIFALCVFLSIGINELKDIFTYIFYLQNFSGAYRLDVYQHLNHTWSLAVEEQFYLIWPVVFLVVYRKSFKAALSLCVIAFFVSAFLRIFLVHIGQAKLAYTLMFSHMDGLLMGAFLSLLFRNYRPAFDQYKDAIKLLCGALTFIVIIIFMKSSNVSMAIVGVQAIPVALLFAGILILAIISDKQNFFYKILSSSVLRHVGSISYGLYIFHVPIMHVIGFRLYDYQLGFLYNHLILFIIGGVISYVISVVSFYVYEKPILKLKYKFAPN